MEKVKWGYSEKMADWQLVRQAPQYPNSRLLASTTMVKQVFCGPGYDSPNPANLFSVQQVE